MLYIHYDYRHFVSFYLFIYLFIFFILFIHSFIISLGFFIHLSIYVSIYSLFISSFSCRFAVPAFYLICSIVFSTRSHLDENSRRVLQHQRSLENVGLTNDVTSSANRRIPLSSHSVHSQTIPVSAIGFLLPILILVIDCVSISIKDLFRN